MSRILADDTDMSMPLDDFAVPATFFD